MKEPQICILLIDDEESVLHFIRAALQHDNIDILSTTSPLEGLRLVREHHPHVILMDLTMPEMNGMEALPHILEIDPRVEVIFLTGDYSTESAVLAVQKGASDYWTKPINPELLRDRVHSLVTEIHKRQRQTDLDAEVLESFQFEGIIGRSPLVLNMLTRIRRVAPHCRNILIVGESGTGKELVAQAIHRLGPAGDRPIVACNCAAIVEELFDSEMFGHLRGAFTGADSDRTGMFELADGSSIFLDEIGELALPSQAKLLRTIQEQEIRRVGSGTVKTINVRVIAATNRDLKEGVRQKQFREDLYYRLAMVEIPVPALRDRKEDLPLLQTHFLKRFSQSYGRNIRGLTRRAQIALAKHTWPGNIRELENVLGHGCMVAEGSFVDLHDLPQYLHNLGKQSPLDPELTSMDEMQRRHAQRVLEHVGGNKVQAAQVLGISRATLYRLLNSRPPLPPSTSTQ